ncbi:MAG: hypothetical protein IJX85_06920 [Lachnospiraceae bacterium]|nr:hypothetical protein [Lachnospiraceae bacterium]
MPAIIILLICIILLINNSQLVIQGATEGLLLWYKNVLPLLLPFMLISGLLEEAVIKQCNQKTKNKSSLPVFSVIFMGLFCGYPIGAKSSSFFLKQGLIDKRRANIILPVVNNVSPMFFIGFIIENTLNNKINIHTAYTIVYLPYIIFITLELILTHHKKRAISSYQNTYIIPVSQANTTQSKSISENSISQITFVGLYIMLCSIVSEFIFHSNLFDTTIKLILVGATEITRGVVQISQTSLMNEQIKTALILACTSFGGISSILQTNKVIQDSGLSLLHYIFVKLLCAIGSFYLCILII